MQARAPIVLRLSAVVAALLGSLLVLGTWDGLWETLDLPQPQPAMYAQVGGAAALGLAWALWAAATRPELRVVVAAAGTFAFAAGAAIIAAWLIFEDPELDLGIDALGIVLVAIDAVVLAALALALGSVARLGPGSGR